MYYANNAELVRAESNLLPFTRSHVLCFARLPPPLHQPPPPPARLFYHTRHESNVLATRYHVHYSHIVNILPCLFHSSYRFIGASLCWCTSRVCACVRARAFLSGFAVAQYRRVCGDNFRQCEHVVCACQYSIVVNTLVFVRCVQICRCFRFTVFFFHLRPHFVCSILASNKVVLSFCFCTRIFLVAKFLFLCSVCSKYLRFSPHTHIQTDSSHWLDGRAKDALFKRFTFLSAIRLQQECVSYYRW